MGIVTVEIDMKLGGNPEIWREFLYLFPPKLLDLSSICLFITLGKAEIAFMVIWLNPKYSLSSQSQERAVSVRQNTASSNPRK